MRRKVYSAFSPAADLKNYCGQVNFCGFIGADQEYSAFAADEDAAREDILQQAKDDLEIEEVNQIYDTEWDVRISFAGFIGVEEVYTVSADDESEAEDAALNEAEWDLEIVELTQED